MNTSFARARLLYRPERCLERLPDVALVGDTSAVSDGANRVQEFLGDSKIDRLLFGPELELKRREVLGADLIGQILVKELFCFTIGFEHGQFLAHIF